MNMILLYKYIWKYFYIKIYRIWLNYKNALENILLYNYIRYHFSIKYKSKYSSMKCTGYNFTIRLH